VRFLIAAIFLLAGTAYASADAEIISMGNGAYCVLYAKVEHRVCTHKVNKEKGTASVRCTGSVSAGNDTGSFVLVGNVYPSKTPPVRTDRTPLLECNAGTNILWYGCTIRGGPSRNSAHYSATCGSCEKDGTGCRTYEGTLSITGVSQDTRKASAQ
jgi:hypothetical protein